VGAVCQPVCRGLVQGSRRHTAGQHCR
jgi:hypothetical protein